MKTKERVLEILGRIIVPGAGRSPLDMNIVRYVWISDRKAEIKLAAVALNNARQEWLKKEIEKLVSGLDGIDTVQVNYAVVPLAEINKIGRVVAVVSGANLPDKPLVSGLAAVALRRQGYSVGILDADIRGRAILKMFGLPGGPPGGENGCLPSISKSGVVIASLDWFVQAENEDPNITITRVGESVFWGDLDFLIVDLPSGLAADSSRILLQLAVSGILVVSSPPDLAAAELIMALNSARPMGQPDIAVVELVDDRTVSQEDEKTAAPENSKIEDREAGSGIPFRVSWPTDSDLVRQYDAGTIADRAFKEIEAVAGFISRLPSARQTFRPDCRNCSHICDGNCKG